jgi:tight adherence protein C
MSPMAVVVASFLLAAGITFLVALLLLRFWMGVRADRLAPRSVQGAPQTLFRWEEAPAMGWQGALERLGQAVAGAPEKAPSKYRQRLIWAGYYNPRAVLLFVGAKVALAIGLGSSYLLYGLLFREITPNLLAVSVILAVAGFFLPDWWLRKRIKARQTEIVHALPDVLDLLMVCVEAGMGFDAAVARVAEQPEVRSSPLHQEMLRMHLEMRAGRPRAEALRALGDRTGAPEVKAMVGAFVQTEKLGTPLGRTLRVHAESARVQRRHRAEERAHLAPLKMLFPTVFFLMPAFFLVALAPALLGLSKLLQTMGR